MASVEDVLSKNPDIIYFLLWSNATKFNSTKLLFFLFMVFESRQSTSITRALHVVPNKLLQSYFGGKSATGGLCYGSSCPCKTSRSLSAASHCSDLALPRFHQKMEFTLSVGMACQNETGYTISISQNVKAKHVRDMKLHWHCVQYQIPYNLQKKKGKDAEAHGRWLEKNLRPVCLPADRRLCKGLAPPTLEKAMRNKRTKTPKAPKSLGTCNRYSMV